MLFLNTFSSRIFFCRRSIKSFEFSLLQGAFIFLDFVAMLIADGKNVLEHILVELYQLSTFFAYVCL